MSSTALLTDHYELTMLEAALRSGAAARRCVFEVFARRLPDGRRYGVVAGTGRLLDAIERFRFADDELEHLRDVVDEATLSFLADYRFDGDVWGYAEGECYFPGSPVLVVESDFAHGVVLETLVLSILNHDSAIASAASRMTAAAGGRPCIEMGSRRTHEEAAVAAARAAYLAGFATTSNLEAGRRFGVPTAGTAAHAFSLLHDDEREAFAAQIAALGKGTTLLVDTYDVPTAVALAVELAGPELGGVRLDSGDLLVQAREVRDQLDRLGATHTQIVVTSDLDEYAIAALLTDADWVERALRWNGEQGIGFLGMDGDNDVACGMVGSFLDEHDATRADLISMWVADTHRSQGIGRRLVNAVVDWARMRGAGTVLLMVTSNNDSAITFYERLGFNRTGRTEPYPNDPALEEYGMSNRFSVSFSFIHARLPCHGRLHWACRRFPGSP